MRRVLAGRVNRLQFVDDRLLGVMARFAKPFRALTGWDVSRIVRVIEPVYNLLKGVPTDAPMASAYWRKRTAPPEAPDPDPTGVGFCGAAPSCRTPVRISGR